MDTPETVVAMGAYDFAINLSARSIEAKTEQTLCGRCRWGQEMRRAHGTEPMVFCRSIGRGVPSDIMECTGYLDRKSMDLGEMQWIAKPVDPRVGVQDGSYR